MKKLPEEDLWKGLQSRLGDYKEDPDDETWEKISAAIPRTNPSKEMPWNRIIASTLLLVAFSTLLLYQYGGQSGQQDKMAEGTETSPEVVDDPELNIGQNPTDKVSGSTNDKVKEDAKVMSENSSIMNHLTPDSSGNVDASSQSFSSKGTATDLQDNRDHSHSDLASVTPEGTKYLEPEKSSSDSFTIDSPDGPIDKNSLASTIRENNDVVDATSNGTKKVMTQSGTLPSQYEPGDSKGSGLTLDPATEELETGEELNTITDKSELKTNSKGIGEGADSDSEKIAPDAIQGSTFNNGNNTARRISGLMEDSVSVKTKGLTQEFTTQERDTKELKDRNRKFYFSITPSLAFVVIKPVTRDAVNVVALNSPGIFNKERLGLSIDAGIQQALGQRMEWWAGVSFYRQSQLVNYEYEIPAVSITADGSGGYSVSPAIAIGVLNYRMLNAGFSTGLFYKLKGVKLMHKVGIGIQYQRGTLKGSREMSYDNSDSQYLNYQLSYRIEFPMNEKVNLYLQPSFTHVIVSSEKLAEPFSVTPYRAGVAFGISFSNLKRSSN